jgi:hypothetical protein
MKDLIIHHIEHLRMDNISTAECMLLHMWNGDNTCSHTKNKCKKHNHASLSVMTTIESIVKEQCPRETYILQVFS